MPAAMLNGGERRWQPSFSFRRLGWALLLVPLLLLESDREDPLPTRRPAPPALADIRVRPVPMPAAQPGEVAIGTLVELSSDEPRFGGLSALAIDGREFVAVSDSGTAVRWPMAGGKGRFRDLPDGPGDPHWKIHRDSEALLRDPAGRGWWVAFEQFHEVRLFDPAFERSLAGRTVGLRSWWRNWGVESLLPGDQPGQLLLLPENGGSVILLGPRDQRSVPFSAPGQIADAVMLPEGRRVVALRETRPWGIRNSLAWLVRRGDGFAAEPIGALPLARWDNVEGLAAEPLPRGRTRLWFVTDNDFERQTKLGSVILEDAGSALR
jgi:hypothetical protein